MSDQTQIQKLQKEGRLPNFGFEPQTYGRATSTEQRNFNNMQRLKEQYTNSEYDWRAAARNKEGPFTKFGASIGYGAFEGITNIANVPGDLAGQESRFDLQPMVRRQADTKGGQIFLDVTSGITQFVTGLPLGGPVGRVVVGATTKGLKVVRGAKAADKFTQGVRKRELARKGIDWKTGNRISSFGKVKAHTLDGVLRGYIADFSAFDGDHSLLMSFFQSNPELQDAYRDITTIPGWERMTNEELTAETTTRMGRAWHNLSGRGMYATEGAVLNGFFNVFWQSIKLAWLRDGLLIKGAEGGSKKAIKGAERTAARAEKAGLSEAEKVKIGEEELSFATPGKQVRMDTNIDDEVLGKVAKEESELSKEVSKHEEALDAVDAKKSDLNARAEETELVPHKWDDDLVPRDGPVDPATGLNTAVYEGKPVLHNRDFAPPITKTVKGNKAVDIIIRGANDAEVLVNQELVAKAWGVTGDLLPSEFLGVTKKGAPRYGKSKIARDAFNNAAEYEAWLIARHQAKIKFSKVKGEKAYQNRLDIHAANTLKRKGIGNLWKYEFDAIPGFEHLTVDQKIMDDLLFKGGSKDAKYIARQLELAAQGKGKGMDDLLLKATKVMNIDGTLTDAGQKYFSSRLMHFFMINMRKTFVDPKSDQLAKAIGWLADPQAMTPKDHLINDVINHINNIADTNSMNPRMVMERFRKGYGDYKELFPELKVPAKDVEKSLMEDASVMKELYIRTWAYRLDQVVSMTNFQKLNKKIADGAKGSKFFVEYLRELKKLEAKLTAFQKLRTATGRALAAHKSLEIDKNLGGNMKKMREEIINRGGGKEGLQKLATRVQAVIDQGKEAADLLEAGRMGATEAGMGGAKKLLNKTITGVDIHNEYWLNSILSSFKTQAVNTIGTALHLTWKPLEGLLGTQGSAYTKKYFRQNLLYSAIITAETLKLLTILGMNKLRHGIKGAGDEAYHEGRKAVFGKATHGAGALAGARKAFRSGKPTLESRSALFDLQPEVAITGDILPDGIANSEFLGAPVGRLAQDMMNWAGKMIRLPSRFMISTDELFKQVSFRASAMARLTAEGFEHYEKQGIRATKEQLSNYAGTRFQGLVRKSGSRYTPDILEDEAWAMYTQAVRHANDSGEPLPKEYGTRDDFIVKYVDQNYDSKRSTLSDYAMENAEDVTFTRQLDQDFKVLQEHGRLGSFATSVQKEVQDIVGRHGFLRILMPFIRTPVNLLKFPLQRFPIAPGQGTIDKMAGNGGLMKRFHMRYQADMLSGDAIKMAEARGRIATGMFMYTGLGFLAASGVVTGAGPQDARQRRTKMATGWKPYSIQVGNKYISYQRLDPFASVLGMSADIAEFLEEADRLGDFDKEWAHTLMLSGVYSISNNILNKSYLAGLTTVLQAGMNPAGKQEYFDRLVEKQLTSYIPKAFSQFTPLTDDPMVKATYDLMDSMKAQIPGFAGSVEPRRNLMGEPVTKMDDNLAARASSLFNPFPYATIKNDEVLDNLAFLNYGFTPMDPKLSNQPFLDMRDFKDSDERTAYDYWQERVGKTKISGRTLRETLMKLFRHSTYRKASELSDRPEWPLGSDDPRVKWVSGIMQRYRAKSKMETLKRYPELLEAFSRYKSTQRRNLNFSLTR
jgi:hypothetical protein